MRRIGIFLTNRKVRVVGLCVLCCLMLLMSSVAYGYLDYGRIWAIGGGGTSSGGSFTLMGTIGQPIVGVCSGGPYVLTSGFLFNGTPYVTPPRPVEPEPEPEPEPLPW